MPSRSCTTTARFVVRKPRHGIALIVDEGRHRASAIVALATTCARASDIVPRPTAFDQSAFTRELRAPPFRSRMCNVEDGFLKQASARGSPSDVRRAITLSSWLSTSLVFCSCVSCGGLLQGDSEASAASTADARDPIVDIADSTVDTSSDRADVLEESVDDAGSLRDVFRDAANACPNGVATGDAAACAISAANYDTSCTQDADCATVLVGNFCGPRCLCGGGPYGPINLVVPPRRRRAAAGSRARGALALRRGRDVLRRRSKELRLRGLSALRAADRQGRQDSEPRARKRATA
jgi:hypothetical protein